MPLIVSQSSPSTMRMWAEYHVRNPIGRDGGEEERSDGIFIVFWILKPPKPRRIYRESRRIVAIQLEILVPRMKEIRIGITCNVFVKLGIGYLFCGRATSDMKPFGGMGRRKKPVVICRFMGELIDRYRAVATYVRAQNAINNKIVRLKFNSHLT